MDDQLRLSSNIPPLHEIPLLRRSLYVDLGDVPVDSGVSFLGPTAYTHP
jgi:hypothetical protein